jgi:hypothetical protein
VFLKYVKICGLFVTKKRFNLFLKYVKISGLFVTKIFLICVSEICEN